MIDGEIINADSMQVYKNFSILTSHPSNNDMSKIKHHLFGYVDTNQSFNAAIWLKHTLSIIEDIHNREKNPIIVGGSGLYLEFLCKGINDLPEISYNTKLKVKKILESRKLIDIYNFLTDIDPKYCAKIEATDKFRITKLLEVFYETKNNITFYYKKKRNINNYNFLKILNLPNKEIIKKNIEKRFSIMLKKGLINEIEINKNKVKNCNIEKAIGYVEIIDYLKGKISINEARANILKKTKSYAKRQKTWFKNRFNEDLKTNSIKDIPLIVESFLKIN